MTNNFLRKLADMLPFDPTEGPTSITAQDGTEWVQVVVSYRCPSLVLAEAMWANPVAVEDDGFGVYMLRMAAPAAGLQNGDLVEASPDCDSHLRMTGIMALSGTHITGVRIPDGTSEDAIEQVTERWRAGGALATVGDDGMLVTAWPEDVPPDEVLRLLDDSSPDDWEFEPILTTTDRALQMINNVDFNPDLGVPLREVA
ncbi:MAG TPA: hypothetical protein VFC82_01980 [Actinomycetaceae bacterium]|nr:hypothetical protein [Actinomycetaceae bacterium]